MRSMKVLLFLICVASQGPLYSMDPREEELRTRAVGSDEQRRLRIRVIIERQNPGCDPEIQKAIEEEVLSQLSENTTSHDDCETSALRKRTATLTVAPIPEGEHQSSRKESEKVATHIGWETALTATASDERKEGHLAEKRPDGPPCEEVVEMKTRRGRFSCLFCCVSSKKFLN